MLRAILTATAVMAAGSAMASSIEVISGPRIAGESIVSIGCEACPPLHSETARPDYEVPVLDGPVQKVEIRQVGDERLVVRTENWSGGSPVVRISKSGIWAMGTDGVTVAVAPSGDGIDHSTTTAAVQAPANLEAASMAGAAPVATTQAAAGPQFGDFDLRLEN